MECAGSLRIEIIDKMSPCLIVIIGNDRSIIGKEL